MAGNLYVLEGNKPNPRLTEEMVVSAEKTLDYKLPESYLEVLRELNGGYIHKFEFIHNEVIEGQGASVCIPEIFGIGYDGGIDGKHGSQYLIQEWDYPDIGIVISSEGHTAIMLDYSSCGKTGDLRWSESGRKISRLQR